MGARVRTLYSREELMEKPMEGKLNIFLRRESAWHKVGTVSNNQPISELCELLFSLGNCQSTTVRIEDERLCEGRQIHILYWKGKKH